MRLHLLAVFLGLGLLGCKAKQLTVTPRRAEFTAEQGSEALVRFIRSNPGTFMGNPDPDRLAQCPLMASGAGRYSFGAFNIDVIHRSYFAALMKDTPVQVWYRGQFIEVDGVWTALPPNIQHVVAHPKPPVVPSEPPAKMEIGASAF